MALLNVNVMEKVKAVLGEDTHIKLGLAIAMFAAVWWAAALTSKVDSILINQGKDSARIELNHSAINDIQRTIELMNVSGTVGLKELEKRVEALEKLR